MNPQASRTVYTYLYSGDGLTAAETFPFTDSTTIGRRLTIELWRP